MERPPALDSGQLRVVYQPQIDLATGRLTGVEALARWDHPALGPITPDTFIPRAEEKPLHRRPRRWMMRTACAQVRAWSDAGLPSLDGRQPVGPGLLWRARIVERVTEVLAITGVDPEQLELEVVAEGVVTEAQQSFLARNGCDIAQGYLVGRPVDPAQIEAMLRPDSVLATAS